MKRSHIHRGHCQLCASVQAIDPDTHRVAKHGYSVDGGYFHGICPGSDELSLHETRELADQHIAQARQEAVTSRELADHYETGSTHPTRVWGGQYKLVATRGSDYSPHPDRAPWTPLSKVELTVLWEDATPEYQERGRTREIQELRQRARMCETYATTLEQSADRITGKIPPFEIEDRRYRGLRVGDKVRIDGTKGVETLIEAIEDRPYPDRGWIKDKTTLILQAQVTHPATPTEYGKDGLVLREGTPSKTYWVPLQHLKKA